MVGQEEEEEDGGNFEQVKGEERSPGTNLENQGLCSLSKRPYKSFAVYGKRKAISPFLSHCNLSCSVFRVVMNHFLKSSANTFAFSTFPAVLAA